MAGRSTGDHGSRRSTLTRRLAAQTPGSIAGRAIGALLLAASIPLLALPDGAASAHVRARVDVFPGRRALQKALAKAQPGDDLVLHAGTYRGAVTISTSDITIEPAGDGQVTIDGRCSAIQAIAVAAPGVTLSGDVTV